MKNWFAKFKLSSALDHGQTVSESMTRKLKRAPALASFNSDLAALDRALRTPPPLRPPPEGLHESIIQAVRVARASTRRPVDWMWVRWAPLAAAGVLLVFTIWQLSLTRPGLRPLSEQARAPFAPAVGVFEFGAQVAHDSPELVMGPLTREWQSLNRDILTVQEFLLASVP